MTYLLWATPDGPGETVIGRAREEASWARPLYALDVLVKAIVGEFT
ncbi:MAG TPA: hypothetical protein VFJ59_08585 [Pseudolabrys sp.]|nr:hypothetical protein [Pseudolabrys sp.]